MYGNDQRPTVLHLVDGFREGGAERQAVQLATAMHEAGRYRVRFACLDGAGPLRAQVDALRTGEVPEYRLTSFYDRNAARQLSRFASFLRRERVSVVHTHDFYTNIFGMAAAALARVPVRIAERLETGGIRTAAQKKAEVLALKLASAVVANADDVRRCLEDEGMRPDKIHVIYNGIDTKRVDPPLGFDRARALEALGLPASPRYRFVTVVANLRLPVKDIPTFIRAACRVALAVPDAAFVVAGEGELRPQLEALARELNLERRMFFVGRCDRIAELLAVSSVGVLSSRAEGFSNAILEYMAARLPVVATDVGGAREAIVEGVTGHLVNAGDDAMLAQRLQWLLGDPYRAKLMGAHGRRIALERFSAEAHLANVHTLYAELLGLPLEEPAPLVRRTAA